MTNDLLLTVFAAATIGAVAGLWHYNREYRRVTGDRSYAYLSPNRWRLIGLVLRPQRDSDLSKVRVAVLTLLAVWLVLAVAVLSVPLKP